LRKQGFEALLAGGCVRDMLLGRPAKDYDVATSARPENVTQLFERTLKVGAKFGVVIVLLDGTEVEVATFRTEAGYSNGRHPQQVTFSSAAEDAGRRDFTINGMFYDPIAKKLIDYVGGRADLKKRLVRTIGEPQKRFSEDFLRMLRAIRFSTQLRFDIEGGTWAAICNNAEKIKKISAERIAAELENILTDPNRSDGASKLVQSKLGQAMFAGFAGEQADFGVGALGCLGQKVDFALALAALFAGYETALGVEMVLRLKLSRNHNKHVKFLLQNRGRLLNSEMSLGHLKLVLAEPYFWDLYELQRAIQKAGNQSLAPLAGIRRRVRRLAGEDIRPKPLLDGHELIRLGAIPGPQVGQLAREMYIAQLGGQLRDAQEARKWVQDWLERHKDTAQ
jgi:tRNA nucleotidyltransferase/poly(A) polymerase